MDDKGDLEHLYLKKDNSKSSFKYNLLVLLFTEKKQDREGYIRFQTYT